MKGYLAVFKIRIKTLLQYRAVAFAGICTQAFWGIIVVMIFHAFYQNSSKEPISLTQAVTFIWLGQALMHLLPWNFDKEIESQVKTGNVAYELIRPLHLYVLWFTRSFALRLVPTAMRSLPIFILGGCFFGLTAPISWESFLFFCISAFAALFLSSAITTLLLISLFWTLSGEGLQRFLLPCSILFSGMTVPLPLFPLWLQPFLSIQPFRCLLDIPCRFYTGIIDPNEAFYYLGFQLAWTIFFILLGKFLMTRATRKFVIQGG
jgi:ABC-2 type transport system permease protein